MCRGVRWLMVGAIVVCIPVGAIIALLAAVSPPPEHYQQAVGIVLEQRGLAPRELSVDVCPAGPTACYQRVYATVHVAIDRPYTGFFTCQRINADCRLTIVNLGISGALMPDIAAADSLADRVAAAISYRLAQLRALVGSWLHEQRDRTWRALHVPPNSIYQSAVSLRVTRPSSLRLGRTPVANGSRR